MATKDDAFSGYPGRTRAQKARFAKEGFDRNVENMRTHYEIYRRPSDPSTREASERLGRGDEKVARVIQRTGRESDSELKRESRRGRR